MHDFIAPVISTDSTNDLPTMDEELLKELESFGMEHSIGSALLELWNAFSDVGFWVKDRNGCFVHVNEFIEGQAQLTRDELIGKRDADCFPDELAINYMQDDAEIIKSGIPIRNKPELVVTHEGGVEWRQTTKFPIENKQGDIIGTTGISRKMSKEVPLPHEYRSLNEIINYAHESLSSSISVSELASRFNLSVSTLERYFLHHLRTTPNHLLKKMRMNRAIHLLADSTLNVSEIASQCGYESVSAFSRAFRRHTEMTPGEYRKNSRS